MGFSFQILVTTLIIHILIIHYSESNGKCKVRISVNEFSESGLILNDTGFDYIFGIQIKSLRLSNNTFIFKQGKKQSGVFTFFLQPITLLLFNC